MKNTQTMFLQNGDNGYKLLGTLRFAQPTQYQFRQSGLTLLEIMITVVILSLGLLGLAGLQLTGLKSNRNAYYNTVAAQVVQDLAERIKADQAGLITTPTKYDAINQPADTRVCNTENPTFENRAACLAAALPGGRALVTKVPDSNPKAFFVALRWSDPQLNGAPGWGAGTTLTNPAKPDASACGDQVIDTNCYYTVFRP